MSKIRIIIVFASILVLASCKNNKQADVGIDYRKWLVEYLVLSDDRKLFLDSMSLKMKIPISVPILNINQYEKTTFTFFGDSIKNIDSIDFHPEYNIKKFYITSKTNINRTVYLDDSNRYYCGWNFSVQNLEQLLEDHLNHLDDSVFYNVAPRFIVERIKRINSIFHKHDTVKVYFERNYNIRDSIIFYNRYRYKYKLPISTLGQIISTKYLNYDKWDDVLNEYSDIFYRNRSSNLEHRE